ncbi:hypothetical protein [Methylorubrum extorquens]|uniref:hypothetical protein n=1 Tax=Methylorubrum extorquens TaxID=408 RepID=UPI0020A01542|nr:hypothetical protein [Methylorubrum extorquens]MCP1540140.1 hypothetical protein [Methylorubrum extorquens]
MIFSRPETPDDRANLRLVLGLNKAPICDAFSDGACGLTTVLWGKPFEYPDDPAFVAIFRDGPEDGREAGRGPRGFHLETVIFAMFEAHRVAIISTRETWSGAREAAVYLEAAEAARAGEIVLIIETDLERGPAWVELFERLTPWMKPLWVKPRAAGEVVR